MLLAATLFLGIVPLFCEAIVFVVLLFPIFSLQLTRDTRARQRLFLSASVFCGLMMLAYGIYWYFILRHAPQIGSRGGFTFDPFNPLIIEANGDEIVVNLPLVTLLERPGVLVQPIHFQLESP